MTVRSLGFDTAKDYHHLDQDVQARTRKVTSRERIKATSLLSETQRCLGTLLSCSHHHFHPGPEFGLCELVGLPDFAKTKLTEM